LVELENKEKIKIGEGCRFSESHSAGKYRLCYVPLGDSPGSNKAA